MTIGVAIPSIPPRVHLLADALKSVCEQYRAADQISVSIDNERLGGAVNRNRAWRALKTDWVAFLDDDDVFYPHHLIDLEACAEETGADLVYPWFDVRWRRAQEPFRFMSVDGEEPEGRPFDDTAREWMLHKQNFIPITVLVRRSLLEAVGGFPRPGSEKWPPEANEDWGCWKAMLEAGAKFAHCPYRTWQWRWHYDHTMGQPEKW